jgi:hypothetical protein
MNVKLNEKVCEGMSTFNACPHYLLELAHSI